MSNDGLRVVGAEEATEEAVRATLGPFVGGAQRYLDGQLAARHTRPVPALKLPRRGVWVGLGAAAAVAAAIALAFALRPGDTQRERDAAASQAERSETADGQGAVASPATPRAPAASAAAKTEQSLQSLDRRAQERWHVGDLAGAKVLFEQMTQVSGDHRYIELAYGDLVQLARQRGRQSEVAPLWRAYLARFPRGRFARDARAVVCSGPAAPDVCRRGLRQDSGR